MLYFNVVGSGTRDISSNMLIFTHGIVNANIGAINVEIVNLQVDRKQGEERRHLSCTRAGCFQP